ncbi:MAG TPA: FAD-binding oxidoreductase [Candidatus Saccharimonadales bacterium]|nr:FAD-binding oxidoreductase [Candidatus Saccharimonadales bacterium]
MNKIAHYLQEHISGEVIASNDARRYFSTDSSIFIMIPAVVVYPMNENDVRKIARFTWQLAERGRVFPITPRGSGTDQTGAAIGSGIILVFPAHLNRVLELDSKTGVVVVEPGTNYAQLQQALFTHDRFLPPYPASADYSTIGGAMGNNAGGEKSLKYGMTIDYVKELRVVLANGEIIETRRLTKRELSKKLGQSNMEGEIYRSLDILIEEDKDLIEKMRLGTTKNTSGYNLGLIKRKDGSFDLTPLFIGSQGTLGIITEATLRTEQRRPNSTLIAALFDNLKIMEEIILELRLLPELPSAIEIVDKNLLEAVNKLNPNLLKNVIKQPFPKFVLMVEFDTDSEHVQKRLSKKVAKLLKDNQIPHQLETDQNRKEELWKIRYSSVAVYTQGDGNSKAVPIIEDGIVPPDKLSKYITAVYELFAKNRTPIAIYGHAGDGHLHLQPLLDLAQVGDRQKIFKIMEEYYKLVVSLGGSITAQHGDGRLRAPFLPLVWGNEVYDLLMKVKLIFDPYRTMNPGVKIGQNVETLKRMIRDEYKLGHLYDHLPNI